MEFRSNALTEYQPLNSDVNLAVYQNICMPSSDCDTYHGKADWCILLQLLVYSLPFLYCLMCFAPTHTESIVYMFGVYSHFPKKNMQSSSSIGHG